MEALASAFGIVLLAEFGDKSMFLSLTAATRFKWWMVLLPIAAAAALVMAVAVIVGGVAGEVLPDRVVAIIAALLFIGFGAWTLWNGDNSGQAALETAPRPAVRVMLALGLLFFLAEFGDKSQVATMSLTGLYGSAMAPFVWLGATAGVVVSNGVAIFIGGRLHRVLPLRLLRFGAAGVFIGFGVATLLLLAL